MVFSSTVFIFIFLPITLMGYLIFRKTVGNYWLLLMSLVFFGWSQPNYLWIILLNIIINYCGAMLISVCSKGRKALLGVTVLLNLAILFYFKYFNFTIDTIEQLMHSEFQVHKVVLPIGISFFTFQGMSYAIDVYRQNVEVQKNPFKVALYITLFPQLIAGPIVRYSDIVNEIDDRKTSLRDFSDGVQRFIIGLMKKVIIANTMASLVDQVWLNGAQNNLWTVSWLTSIAYTLQIYFDFSGYSDMAIGLGRMFGFHFGENFNLPYISKSITEFWRRWHISLSSWFRDYVYIPLGGNRKKVYRNLAIVFLLTGIWHGAAWNFVLWGVWNGVFILAERFVRGYYTSNPKQAERTRTEKPSTEIIQPESAQDVKTQTETSKRLLSVMGQLYTLAVVNFGWILFRAPSISEAVDFVKSMFGHYNLEKIGFTAGFYLDRWTLMILILGVFFASSVPSRLSCKIKSYMNNTCYMIGKYIFLLAAFYLCMMRIVSGTYNPFIYFQF